jgi:hypothetical protein
MIMQQRVIASSILSVSFLAVACVLSVFPGRGLAQEPADPTDPTDPTDRQGRASSWYFCAASPLLANNSVH